MTIEERIGEKTRQLQHQLDVIGEPCKCGCQDYQVDTLKAQLSVLAEVLTETKV